MAKFFNWAKKIYADKFKRYLIEFTVEEFEKMANSVRRKMHLIKRFETFGRSGAIRLKEEG